VLLSDRSGTSWTVMFLFATSDLIRIPQRLSVSAVRFFRYGCVAYSLRLLNLRVLHGNGEG
jgi:hypothetical protein